MLSLNDHPTIRRSLVLITALAAAACGPAATLGASTVTVALQASRQAAIPVGAVKQSPGTDAYPPLMRSPEWSDPIPLPGPVNTAGAEDSPFIAPDGRLYVFFTPSLAVPAEKQLLDGMTGIYVSTLVDGTWQEPARVLLQEPGKLALDGCAFVDLQRLWFCTAREGLTGIHWFVAESSGGEWHGWQPAAASLPGDIQVGELHMSADGATVVFHSDEPRGAGGRDLWMAVRNAGGGWSPSVNLADVNTEADEGWPYLSPDGQQLWFTRTYLGSPCIFRSLREGDRWSEPELIVERFAGEPTLDDAGNLYFVHHYVRDGQLIEADIYAASPRD